MATSLKLAQDASRLVKVQYEQLSVTLSIRVTMAQQSFFAETRQLVNGDGDIDAALQYANPVLEGSLYCGARGHYCLETIGAAAVPKDEDDKME
ncbi:hypothetical protein IWW38_004121, partial [Coemansia aciculifera]